MNIIFQNENFVIAEKPALVLTVPGRDPKDTRPVLGLMLQNELRTKIFPVHRLDYEVSGLIMYAKTKEAHKVANSWFESKEIIKTYEAITETSENQVPLNKKQIWKSKLVRGKKRTFEAAHGLDSETHATCIESYKIGSLPVLRWKLNPITGRSHQLRFELSNKGHPILGDKLYGSRFDYSEAGIALKATELDLSRIENTLGLPKNISLSGR